MEATSISRETKNALDALALAILQDPTVADHAGTAKAGRMGEGLKDDAVTERSSLSDRDYWLYQDVLERLAREPQLEHLSKRDIDSTVSEYIRELSAERDQYRDARRRRKVTAGLLASLTKPWDKYEVAVRIDHVDLQSEVLRLGAVTLFKPDAAWVSSRSAGWPSFVSEHGREMVGRTVAVTEIEAGNPSKALERAKPRIDEALNTMRFALCGAIYANVPDFQMLFRRAGTILVSPLRTGGQVMTTSELGFRPVEMTITDTLADTLTTYLQTMAPLVEDQMPVDIRRHLQRALHWVGTSVTRENFDDKIIDLSTALEALLARKGERNAEAIALRSMLLATKLDGGFADPLIVFDIYLKRSEVVHGSALGVCGDGDYHHLRALTIRTLSQVLELVRREPQLKTYSQVIRAIEEPQLLASAIAWLGSDGRRRARKIAKFGAERLVGTASQKVACHLPCLTH